MTNTRLPFLLFAMLLLAPLPALADPFSTIGLLSAYGTATAAAAGAAGTFWGLSAATWFYVGVAASACGSKIARARARLLGDAK